MSTTHAIRSRSGWVPRSPCGPDCLPPPARHSGLGLARAAARLGGFLVVLAVAVLTVTDRWVCPGVTVVVPAWLCRALLRVLGVRLAHSGADRFGVGTLVVANHLSWLDVVALGAVQPVRLLAKREVRDWPVLGALAARAGTLFVDRVALRALPAVVAELAGCLRAGAAVGVFPEGTTWCGAALGTFRRAAFQAAVDAGAPVRPVALRMALPDGTPTSAGAFLGAETLLASVLRIVRLPGLVVELAVLPPLAPAPGTDRRELARRAELAIAAALLAAPDPVTAAPDPGLAAPARRRADLAASRP